MSSRVYTLMNARRFFAKVRTVQVLAPLAVLTLIWSCSPQLSSSRTDQVVKGHADLTGNDFSTTVIRLRGEWAFFPNTIINPQDVNDKTISQASFTKVPSIWNNIQTKGGTMGAYGYATYAACIILPPNVPDKMTLYLKNTATSYRMFIDGQLVAESGTFSTNPQEARPHSGPVHVTFPVTSPRLQIIIQVCNYTYIKGGLWETPTLGTPDLLLNRFNNLKTFEHFTFAILVFLFVYHLILYILRHRNPEYLAYSITCLVAAMGNSVRSTYIVYDFMPDLNWVILKKSQFILYYLVATGFCYTFLFTFHDHLKRKKFIHVIALYPVLLSIFMLIAPFQAGYYSSFTFHIMFLSGLSAMIFMSARAAIIGNKPIFLLITFGYLCLLIGALLDFIYMLGIVHMGYTMPMAMFVYLALYTIYLAHNFSTAFNRTEELGNKLLIQNKSLATEIEERKKAELQLQNVFNILSHLFDTLENGIALINNDKNILMANNAFYTMFNLSPATTINCATFSSRLACQYNCELDTFTQNQSRLVREFTFDNRLFDCISVPFHGPDGSIQGILHCYTDISDMRLLEQRVMNISEHERRELGQNLHDGLGQSLTAIEYLLDSIILRLAKGHELLPQLEKISDITHSFNDELHSIVKNLYPVKINKYGFSTALEEVKNAANQLPGTNCILTYRGPDMVDPDTATHLYYIIKEAVNNAIKHAQAHNITISVFIEDKHLEAAIWNDGTIPDRMPQKGSWHGLGIMEYRAKMINASFEFAHNPKKGFGIYIRSRD